MRSTKAFFLGLGAALVMGRAWARRGRPDTDEIAVDDATIEHRVLGDALPAAGVSADEIEIEVDDGVVVLQGEVEGPERADALVQRIAEDPASVTSRR